MASDLDQKNGVPFEASSEYLYQKKIAELEAKVEEYRKGLEHANTATEAMRSEVDRLKKKLKAKENK